MRDPFNRAHNLHDSRMSVPSLGQPLAAPAAPMAPGVKPMQETMQPPSKDDFTMLAKQAGIGHLKLDKNPQIARTQLLTHLKSKYGAGYMDHPEVTKLLEAFNSGPAMSTEGMSTGTKQTMQSLLGPMK